LYYFHEGKHKVEQVYPTYKKHIAESLLAQNAMDFVKGAIDAIGHNVEEFQLEILNNAIDNKKNKKYKKFDKA